MVQHTIHFLLYIHYIYYVTIIFPTNYKIYTTEKQTGHVANVHVQCFRWSA